MSTYYSYFVSDVAFLLLGALCSIFSSVMLEHVCFKCYIMLMISYSSSLLTYVVVITNKCERTLIRVL